ncbi:MAG TPA: class III extradiol ring-cleavage dioxygenase [Geothermobacteraceae bacterium]|nr:class III extradiol ring-cleavage dioxygenase [Geothermobacteraceae bacterium]
MAELSTLFVSHGAPDLPLSELPARRALEDLGRSLPRPDAIVIVSAHWEAPLVSVGEAEQHRTIYDFAGFDPQLRQFRYPAPGSPRHVELVRGCLSRAGYEPQVSHDRGLDHGAWVPLLLMFPAADIPVIPVSLLRGGSFAAQRQLGAAGALAQPEHSGDCFWVSDPQPACAAARGDGAGALGAGVHGLVVQDGTFREPECARKLPQSCPPRGDRSPKRGAFGTAADRLGRWRRRAEQNSPREFQLR